MRSPAFLRLAAFFSKDAILYEAFQHGASGRIFWFVGLLTALLTSFYMFRLWYLTFFGEARDPQAHPHESPWSMLGPLVILALLSVSGGWIGMDRFGAFLAPVLGQTTDPSTAPGGKQLDLLLSVLAVAAALTGLFIADRMYRRKAATPPQDASFDAGRLQASGEQILR